MKIYLIKEKATQKQISEMLECLESYIKVAVDIKQKILVGGGELHADCESVLLDHGSTQEDIWGANWYPEEKQVTFEAILNIAPRRNNRSMEIQDPKIREQVGKIVKSLLDVHQ